MQIFPFVSNRFALISASVFTLAFAITHYLLPYNHLQHLWHADLAWTLASLLCALQCLSTAKRLDGNLHTAWQWIGIGCLCWLGGMLYWDYMELFAHQESPFPAPSDFGFIFTAICFSFGLYSFRPENSSLHLAIKEISQLALFMLAIFTAHVVVFYQPIINSHQGFQYLMVALAYPVFYMALLPQSIIKLSELSSSPLRKPLMYVATGFAIHAITDSLYSYQLLGEVYQVGNYIDIAWIVGFGFIYYGAVAQDNIAASDFRQEAIKVLSPGSSRLITLAPTLALLALLVIGIFHRHQITPELLGLVIPLGILILIFTALREYGRDMMQADLIREIKLSEQRTRQLAHAVPVGIFRIDSGGKCTYVNDHWQGITGLSAEESIGDGWRKAIYPEDLEEVDANYRRTLLDRQPCNHNFRILRPDNSIRWVLGQGIVEVDDDNMLIGLLGTVTDITAQMEIKRSLSESEARFRTVFENSPVMVCVSELSSGTIIDVNLSFCWTTGYYRNEIIGKKAADFGLDSNAGHMSNFTQANVGSNITLLGHEWELSRRDGSRLVVFGSSHQTEINGTLCVVFVAQDITITKEATEERDMLSLALAQTVDAVMITDKKGIVEYINQGFEEITGYSSQEVVGKLANILKSGKQNDDFYKRLWETISSGNSFNEIFINRRKNGTFYYEEKTISAIVDSNGEITHFISTGRDTTERIETQQRLSFMAHHDALTELPNRVLFMARLKSALARARWHNRLAAVLFLDIDRFKNINDTLGHDTGDSLLQDLATRLKGILLEGDTIGRFGGDEFVIILEDYTDSSKVELLAKKLIDEVSTPLVMEGSTLHVTGSIGISQFPADGGDAITLLKNADAAMYRAKDRGRNNYQFYSADMSTRALERFTLENALRHALTRDEFVLHYQPQICMKNGSVTGVEALIRWQHPDLGLVPPDKFIPLLEEIGLIVEVGEWVINTSCRQIMEWNRLGWSDLHMAINLSGRQFDDLDLVHKIENILDAHGIDAQYIALEITESIMMRHGQSTLDKLRRLRALGLKIAIDDFGTGYSSLSYLRIMPVDTIKIDRSFITDIPKDENDVAIAKAIIAMGRSLNLNLVAEGVETPQQQDFLLEEGCHLMQGFLYSRPLNAENITKFIKESRATENNSVRQFITRK